MSTMQCKEGRQMSNWLPFLEWSGKASLRFRFKLKSTNNKSVIMKIEG